MAQNNIDNFNAVTGVIFGQLYSSFPIPAVIDEVALVKALGGVAKTRPGQMGGLLIEDMGEFPDGTPIYPIYNAATVWLVQEGFLRRSEWTYVLTAQALTALNAVPTAMRQSFGKQLAEATGSAASEGGRAVIAETVGQVIGAVVRNVLG